MGVAASSSSRRAKKPQLNKGFTSVWVSFVGGARNNALGPRVERGVRSHCVLLHSFTKETRHMCLDFLEPIPPQTLLLFVRLTLKSENRLLRQDVDGNGFDADIRSRICSVSVERLESITAVLFMHTFLVVLCLLGLEQVIIYCGGISFVRVIVSSFFFAMRSCSLLDYKPQLCGTLPPCKDSVSKTNSSLKVLFHRTLLLCSSIHSLPTWLRNEKYHDNKCQKSSV